MNTAKAKTLNEIIAKVAARQVYGEKLTKPTIGACKNEVHEKMLHKEQLRLQMTLLQEDRINI